MVKIHAADRLRRLFNDWPMHSNALIYSGYATAATLAVQVMEQWKDQPMNLRQAESDQLLKGEGPQGMSRWKWTVQLRNGNDPSLVPAKDPIEPYYNLAISAYRDPSLAEGPRKKSTFAQCESADAPGRSNDAPADKVSGTEVRECTFNIDLARVAGMMAFSVCFAGPTNTLLYPFYNRVFGTTSAGINKAVLFDQSFYTPFICIPACYYLNGFVKKWAMRDPRLDDSKEDWVNDQEQNFMYSIEDCFVETTREMKERWMGTWLMSMAIWIPAESVNLRFVPMGFRAVVAGAVGLIWTTGMAAWTHTGSQSLDSTESAKDSSIESSIESGMDSIKNLLARVSSIQNA